MAEVRRGAPWLTANGSGVRTLPSQSSSHLSFEHRAVVSLCGWEHMGRGATVRPADRKPRPALNVVRDLTGVTKLDAHGGGGLMGRD